MKNRLRHAPRAHKDEKKLPACINHSTDTRLRMRDITPRSSGKNRLISPGLHVVFLLIGLIAVFGHPLYGAEFNYTRSIKVKSVPVNFSLINKTRETFGKLLWRGGIEMISTAKDFGGLSGITTNKDGNKFIAVSD
ncbi:MAG TPA: hypothetical protein ENJ99_03260, partial [Rhizobiales bacterium]|nr:hypothetical protein [Hyphomicrobiales bacterium]